MVLGVSLGISETAAWGFHAQQFPAFMQNGATNNKTSGGCQSCEQEHLVEEKRMNRLVGVDRKAIVTQITTQITLYSHVEQN